MTHPLADLLRYTIFGLFGVGAGFMLMTNYMAYRVLRPPRRLGFLWWHVTAVSVSVLCFGTVAVITVASRLGESVTWRSPVTLLGCVLFAVSQTIIFRVERQRLVEKTAQRGISERA